MALNLQLGAIKLFQKWWDDVINTAPVKSQTAENNVEHEGKMIFMLV